MREDFSQRAADDQILLDLKVLHPWRTGAPFGDVVAWDHLAASTSALT
jgi:hypothetical protein